MYIEAARRAGAISGRYSVQFMVWMCMGQDSRGYIGREAVPTVRGSKNHARAINKGNARTNVAKPKRTAKMVIATNENP